MGRLWICRGALPRGLTEGFLFREADWSPRGAMARAFTKLAEGRPFSCRGARWRVAEGLSGFYVAEGLR